MASDTANLVNLYSGPQGSGVYHYDAGSDTMATVAASGYFNNTDDNQNLAADDIIFALCSDGDIALRVASVSSGTVTCNVMSLDGPWNGVVGSASGSITVPGVSEIGTGTATAHVLSGAPTLGAKVTIFQAGSATGGITVVTNATGVSLNNQGDRTITFTGEGQFVSLLGVSTTRWALVGGQGVTYS